MRNDRSLLSCLAGVVAMAGAFGGACSSLDEIAPDRGPSSPSGAGETPTGNEFGSGVSGESGSSGGNAACASVSSEAKAELAPADIIIAIDTSLSMAFESGEVQQNLNRFATIITESGVDVHVVVIAEDNVCIPAPLGSGRCAQGSDQRLPEYRHVFEEVGSNDALQVILATYPLWKDSLRPSSAKTFAVVSDDDSRLGAAAFKEGLRRLDPVMFAEFRFDAIAASQDPFACVAACSGGVVGACCPGCFPISSAEGRVYRQLVQETGGIFGDLCSQDFDPVFASMATAVVGGAKVSCDYQIPPVPDGSTLNTSKVNVTYTPSNGAPRAVGYVTSGAASCGPDTGGWYYDDPQAPKRILLCPATCDLVQRDLSGKVEVQFGCDTVVATPR